LKYIAQGCTIIDYQEAINKQFKRTLELSSNGTMTGQIFYDCPFVTLEPPQATVALDITKEIHVDKKEGEVSVVGGTSMNLSTADSQEIDDGLLLMNLGETSIHELLHTIRLDHPHNYTQTSDTKLIFNSGIDFETTPNTHPNVLYNIMIYGFIFVDGKRLSDSWNFKRPEYLTPGQLNFMLKEIDGQKRGDGTNKPYHNYTLYWAYPPGDEI